MVICHKYLSVVLRVRPVAGRLDSYSNKNTYIAMRETTITISNKILHAIIKNFTIVLAPL